MKISAIINQITFLKGVYYSIWFQENKPAFVFIVLPTISFLKGLNEERTIIQQSLDKHRNSLLTLPVPLQFTNILRNGGQTDSGLLHPPKGNLMGYFGCATNSINNGIYTSYPSFNKSKAGKERHASVHSAQITNFFLPSALTAS